MQAGRLSTPIVIQQQTTTTDAIGQPLLTWTDFAAVWANVRHLSGTESIKAGAVTSTVQASMRTRPMNGVTSGMRVLVDGAVYQIKSVIPDFVRRDSMNLIVELVQ
jgi:SPP1 family predicted phage head-tail adaptor